MVSRTRWVWASPSKIALSAVSENRSTAASEEGNRQSEDLGNGRPPGPKLIPTGKAELVERFNAVQDAKDAALAEAKADGVDIES